MNDMSNMPEIRITPTKKRIRAIVGGETVLDTERAVLLKEGAPPPKYYVPIDDVAMAFFTKTDHVATSPYKGDASHWTLSAGGRTVENAAWAYETPQPPIAALKGYLSLDWKAADKWLEEDDEVFVHARNPHTRIDILNSSRRVRAEIDGVVIADSTHARFLFETDKVPRYYLPRKDVNADLLVESDHRTACPYKGIASYYSVRTPKRLHENLVWYYPDPIDESLRIKDLLCLYNERLDSLTVDGKSVL